MSLYSEEDWGHGYEESRQMAGPTKINEVKDYLKMVLKRFWKYRNTAAVSSSIHTV